MNFSIEFSKEQFLYKTRFYICFCPKKNNLHFLSCQRIIEASIILLIQYLCTKKPKKILLVLKIVLYLTKYFSRNFLNYPLPSDSVSSILSLPIAMKCFNLSNTDFRLVKLGGGLLISRSLNFSSASEKWL